MTIRSLVYYPDERLRQQCREIILFDASLEKLLDDMFETMVASSGIGLAAPQVGEMVQVIVIDTSISGIEPAKISLFPGSKKDLYFPDNRLEIINPKITASGNMVKSEEGCLSIPEFRESIKRASNVTITAQDRRGTPYQLSAQDLLGFCVQHEVDHVNGILFVDHLSRLKRGLFQRWQAKQTRNSESDDE